MHILLAQPLEQIIGQGTDSINAHLNNLNKAIEGSAKAIKMYKDTIEDRLDTIEYISVEYPKIRAEKERLEKEVNTIIRKSEYGHMIESSFIASYKKPFHRGFSDRIDDAEKLRQINADIEHHRKVIENHENLKRAFTFRKEKILQIMSNE